MGTKSSLFKLLAVGAAVALALGVFGAKRISAKPALGGASRSSSPDEIDAYIEQQMARLSIPGASLAIVEGDKITHLRGFGQARPGEAPSPRTPFFIGSITKSFTGVAVMQLVEAGKIDLDAPVQRYLPWFRVADPQASAQITVRHLLNQTSGLSTACGWIPLSDFDDSSGAAERQARALSTLALSHPVGSAFEYSNMNYNLLGLIVEAASGETYPTYIQNHIFAPLGMSHSYTSRDAAKENGLAMGHRYLFATPTAAGDLPVPSGSLPSGQLISSAEDMAHYLIAHLDGGRYDNGRILSPASIEELHRGVADADEMGVKAGRYAMGWYDLDAGDTRLLWHTGVVPDFFAYMALLPEQKKGVAILINADHFMMVPVLTEVGMGVAALLADAEPPPRRFSFIPGTMRGLLLIPALQIVGTIATLRLLRRWRGNPSRRPGGARLWGLHILLPMIPNLSLAAIPVLLQASGLLGFFLLFMPEITWLALISGGFAGVWALLRTWLILRLIRSEPVCRSTRTGPLPST